MKKIGLFLILLLVSASTFAVVYPGGFTSVLFVSPTGNNSTATVGAPGLPWADINTAVQAATPPAMISIMPGTNYGTVTMKNGVSLVYDVGAYHYVIEGGTFYDCRSVTNAQVLGFGTLFRTNTLSSNPSIFFLNTNTNPNLNIYGRFLRLGNAPPDANDDVLINGPFININVQAFELGLITPQSNNTNTSAVVVMSGPVNFAWHDQHSDWNATQKFVNVFLDGSHPEFTHKFGNVEVYGGSYTDDGVTPLDLNDGTITLIGPKVTGPAAVIAAQTWENYPIATNVFGYYLRHGMLYAENSFRVNNQGGASKIEMVSRSGFNVLNTNVLAYDATNDLFAVSKQVAADGYHITNMPVANLRQDGTPTVSTNVTLWTFPNTIQGSANAGGSGLTAGAVVSLFPRSTDQAGIIQVYYGDTTGLANTNIITLTFSTNDTLVHMYMSTVVLSNTTAATVGPSIASVTTSNMLFRSGGTAPLGGASAMITYWRIK